MYLTLIIQSMLAIKQGRGMNQFTFFKDQSFCNVKQERGDGERNKIHQALLLT